MTHETPIHIRGPIAWTEPELGPHIIPLLDKITTRLVRQFDAAARAVDVFTICRCKGQLWFPSVFLDRVIACLRAQGLNPECHEEIVEMKVRFDLSLGPALRQIAREVVGRPRGLFLIEPGSKISEREVVQAIASTHQGRVIHIDDGARPINPRKVPVRGQCLVLSIKTPGRPGAVIDFLLDGPLPQNRYYGVMSGCPQTAEEALWLYALFGPEVRVLGPETWSRCPLEFVRNPSPDQISRPRFAFLLAESIGYPTQQIIPVDRQPDQRDGDLRPGHLFADRPPIYLVVDDEAQKEEVETLLRESCGRQNLRVILRAELSKRRLSGAIVILACRWTLSDLARAEGNDVRQAPPRRIVAVTDRVTESLSVAVG
ncbi:MAG: hypothetical protein IT428_03805 [Planctomycetaceae bacterium]|nr:hypothetical protein [Planctomycetaceae bacterium]